MHGQLFTRAPSRSQVLSPPGVLPSWGTDEEGVGGISIGVVGSTPSVVKVIDGVPVDPLAHTSDSISVLPGGWFGI